MAKIRKWIVMEKTWADAVVICGYNCRESIFDTKAEAQELYDLVNRARGDQSTFKIVKLEAESPFSKLKQKPTS